MDRRSAVVKIGGSLLEDGKSYFEVAERIRDIFIDRGYNVVIVVSAMKGITDDLLKVYEGSLRHLQNVIEKYINAAKYIGGSKLEKRIKEYAVKLESAYKLAFTGSIAIKDLILSFGERISKILLTEALCAIGVKAVELEALELIITNDVHENASIILHETRNRLINVIKPLVRDNITPVIEGFIGTSRHGEITTLGRGGSDYTATAIASLLGVNKVYLISNVPGIMTADPKYVHKARVVPIMSYREAIEATIYGSKRLHPKTFHPLMRSNVKVYIGSWDGKGTIILRDISRFETKTPKLITFKCKGDIAHTALIGEGINNPKVIGEILGYIQSIGLEYEGFYTFKNRPSAVFLFNKDILIKALNELHKLILEVYNS